MHELGVKIYLHCFEYGRGKPIELQDFCEEIFYYKRNSNIKTLFSKTPFRINSRSSAELKINLKKIKAPILFEGLHTTHCLINEDFEDRKILVRTHNIEHLYHKGLAKSERKIHKKLFFRSEAYKLISYEKILHKATQILAISPYEYTYFKKRFGERVHYIPAFHENTAVTRLSKKGNYALYHGDLRVSDNKRSIHFLIDLFKKIKYPLIIASSFKNKKIIDELKKHENIKFVEINHVSDLKLLLNNAQVNVLPTFQKTGIKLKLINVLFNSRFCIVTKKMVEDTGLEKLCFICDNNQEFQRKILELKNKNFDEEETFKRSKVLEAFDTTLNARKIIQLID